MSKYFALIKNNIVESIAVGDDDFFEYAKTQYDVVIDVTDGERPNVGDSYYADVEAFISNSETSPKIDVDLGLEHLQQGTDEGFEPFRLSGYAVKYENGIVTIGCKKYPALGLLDSLHKVLIDQETTVHCFSILSDAGPGHGKFGITWADTRALYTALIKVKLQ